MRLSVLIPVFNEVTTVAAVVKRIQALPLDLEIILVDDGSSDGTSHILKQLASTNVTVIHHPVNRGKGAAIRTALEVASGDVVVIQDADFECDPNDLVQLYQFIYANKADVVFGVRSFESQSRLMRLGNQLITAIANVIYSRQLKDVETCYKMMVRKVASSLNLECSRFDIEAEITAKLIRAGYVIHELPINYAARVKKKKLSIFDGIPTLYVLWKYRRWKPTNLCIDNIF